MSEYLNVTIVVEKSGRWVGNRPLKFSEFVRGEISEEDIDIEVKYNNNNSCMILRDREALGAYERFFKVVTKLPFVVFEEEFTAVFFDNELDGIIVEKTMVSEELYTTVRLAISN